MTGRAVRRPFGNAIKQFFVGSELGQCERSRILENSGFN